MSENILCVKNIKKSFGGVHALKGVDLTIKKGETHCLAGENGCGKSTIIKVISGFYKPDEGTIEIDGKEYTNMSTADAIAAGIQVIYQDFSIFPNLTVMENLAFNQVLAEKKKFVNKREFRKIAEEAVKKINFDVDLDARVETLPVADKQLIAISRALLHNAKLIIMDEPTTALTKKEVTRLFGIIEELKKEGITILFVSHKLDEVFEISDSITILRSGQNVYKCPAKEMTEEKFTYYMTGRNIDTTDVKEVKDFSKSDKVLEVKNLSAKGFEHVSFDLHAGEILGIAGQLGSGRTELSLALFGMLKPTNGSISVSGETVHLKNVAEAQKNGIALVPEDRLTEGLFLPQSIYKNISVTSLKEISGAFGVVKEAAQKELSAHWVKEIGVATKDHKFNSLIVTLGTSSICSGILFGAFEAGRTELPDKLYKLSKINIATVTNAKSGLSSSLPVTFIIMIVLYVIAYLILNYTMAGRSVYAVGGDEVSAQRAGINVGKVRFLVFVVNGGIAAIAGLCYAMMSYFYLPNEYAGAEMLVIAAVILGGTRMTGGIGTLRGCLLGTLLLTMVANSLILLGISVYWEKVFIGAIIIIGTAISAMQAKSASKTTAKKKGVE